MCYVPHQQHPGHPGLEKDNAYTAKQYSSEICVLVDTGDKYVLENNKPSTQSQPKTIKRSGTDAYHAEKEEAKEQMWKKQYDQVEHDP